MVEGRMTDLLERVTYQRPHLYRKQEAALFTDARYAVVGAVVGS